MFLCTSCGDCWSDTTYSIDNKTEYNIIVQSTEIEIINKICPPNKETVIYRDDPRSKRELHCSCPSYISKEQIEFVVDDGNKHLRKDFFDNSNWKCTGDKRSSFAMGGKYYDNIINVFIITEDDLE